MYTTTSITILLLILLIIVIVTIMIVITYFILRGLGLKTIKTIITLIESFEPVY